jgi:hypothetical protein
VKRLEGLNLLTKSIEQSPSDKLMFPHILKKFLEIYGALMSVGLFLYHSSVCVLEPFQYCEVIVYEVGGFEDSGLLACYVVTARK